MRFSLVTFATVAFAIASTSVKADSSNAVQKTEEVLDKLGNKIEFVTGTGDHDFDDDDDDVQPVRRSRKHAHRKSGKSGKKSSHMTSSPKKGSKLKNSNTKITWYASNDLKNPQCGDGSWNPDNASHIGAVMAGWEGGPQCGDFVQLCNDKLEDGKCLSVRIVDKCAGCKQKHVDLTKSAFKQLASSHSLDEGVVDNLKLYQLDDNPSPWDTALFGPFKLKA